MLSGVAAFGASGVLATVPPPALADNRLTFFRIGTGPTAETLYFLGTAISAGISRPPGGLDCDQGGLCGVPGLIAVAQSYSGSIENIEALAEGSLESALVHTDMAYRAYTGTGPFKHKAPLEDLRNIANLGSVSMHIVVRADSNIDTPRELVLRRVSLGPHGAGSVALAIRLLRLYGIKMQSLRPYFMESGEAADALEAGEIDAFFAFGSEPIDAIEELHSRIPIRLLPLESSATTTMVGFYPFMHSGTITADVYKDIPETLTLRLGVVWVVREGANATLIERITRALWQGATADLFRINSPGHEFPARDIAASKSIIPLHPGAKRYYKRVGTS